MMTEFNLPEFFIIGAAKSGSTTLYHWLKQHPQIVLSEIKEPHFFDNNTNYKRGLSWYAKHFHSENVPHGTIGEATPNYFHHPELVIPRLKKTYADKEIKFILVLRDPVQRAWSHYCHRRRLMLEPYEFIKALNVEQERLSKKTMEWTGYFKDGLYAIQLQKWYANYSKDQFLILLTEELENYDKCLSEIFNFLQVSTTVQIDTSRRYNTAKQPKNKTMMRLIVGHQFLNKLIKWVTPETVLAKLLQYRRRCIDRNLVETASQAELHPEIMNDLRLKYTPDIEQLEKLINKDLNAWKQRN
jgi:hypothetical protein